MGQQVYVLMALEGSGKNRNWRPMGVVTNPEVAEQWEHYGGGVDWVPFELDDIKDITPEKMPTFQPRKLQPGEERAKQLAENMEATIQRLQKIIDDQAAVIKRLSGKKSSKAMGAGWITSEGKFEPVQGDESHADAAIRLGLSDEMTTERGELPVLHSAWLNDHIRVLGGEANPEYSAWENNENTRWNIINDIRTNRFSASNVAVEFSDPQHIFKNGLTADEAVEWLENGGRPDPKIGSSAGWAKELTPHEAWRYAEQMHDGQIVQDYFFIAGGSDDSKDKRQVVKYVLQTVETNKLLGAQDDMLTDSYAEESPDTQPPLVVNAHGVVIDGTHRLGAALRRGDESVLAYVPIIKKGL